jgi:uncharacterized membrane protein
MNKGRLEAFSDGVMAIIITIMVLELKPPQGATLADLWPLRLVFLSYVLSFVYVAIYWNNHHHLFQAVKQVNGPILLANTHLLFWLSLLPFVTAWSGENHFSEIPMAVYGIVLLMSGVAYTFLTALLLKHHGSQSDLARAMGRDFKGKASVVAYVVAIPLALWAPLVSFAIYILVAAIWVIPDSRIERVLKSGKN